MNSTNPDAQLRKDHAQAEPPWQHASVGDLADFDFEAPIATAVTADCEDFAAPFRNGVQRSGEPPVVGDTAANRIFLMLAALTGMQLRPSDVNEPFKPLIVWSNGNRSATPADFHGPLLPVIAEMAQRAANSVLRARLADLAWLLDRKRGQLGRLAIASYIEVIERVDRGELHFRGSDEIGALHWDARRHLRRAIQIARATGWDKAESVRARNLIITLRLRAIDEDNPGAALRFSELDLDTGLSDPADVAFGIERALAKRGAEIDPHLANSLWRLAARAYQTAKSADDRFRCQLNAAEALVSGAEVAVTRSNQAMIAAHWLSAAIAQLHGVPSQRERRKELRHRLVDIQAQIPEEMTVFTYEMSLGDIAERVREALTPMSLVDKLFAFATLEPSPDPAQLVKDAREQIEKHPLSSIVPTSHFDREGKVVYRSEGGPFDDRENNSAIEQQIAQAESIRRRVTVGGKIEPARQQVVGQHYMSEDVVALILRHSPFVPEDLIWTFSRGFTRLLQGDFASAIYTLTPLLENSLRHALRAYGHDVSKFDDATQTQEDLTISALFEQLRPELDSIFTKPITTEIENLFLKKPGPSLRHDLAHGLFHDGTPYGADAIYGCWLIFRLCMLPLYPYRDQLPLYVE